MTLTRELRAGIAFIFAVFLVLAALAWGNQRQAHAQVVDVGQILCYVDQQGDARDGGTGTFPVFRLGDCTDSSPIKDWCPSIPGDQTQADLPCTPPETDVCPNIDGLQAAVPEGKVLSGGICIDAGTGGGGDSSSDLSVQKTVSDTSPAPSSTIAYTIVVHNAGPDAAADVSATDILPSGVAYVSDDSGGAYAHATGVWTIGTVASGADATLTITATNESVAGTQVSNTASIAHSGSSDPASGNNSAEASFTSTAGNQGGGGTGGGGSPQCSDGIDNDNDGQIDYPADTDCIDANDNSEAPSSGGGGGGGNRRNGSSGAVASDSSGGGEVLGAQTEMCPMYLTGYIKYGAANDMGEVAKLQVFLNGYEADSLKVTGAYDQATLAAVNAFQRKYASDVLTPWGLKGATGYVYYTTQKQVNTIYCKFQRDFPLSAAQVEEIADVRAIQPRLRSQGAASAGASGTAAAPVEAAPAAPAAAGSVLPGIKVDENASSTGSSAGDATQTAPAANASSTPGWFGKFVRWLFGR